MTIDNHIPVLEISTGLYNGIHFMQDFILVIVSMEITGSWVVTPRLVNRYLTFHAQPY